MKMPDKHTIDKVLRNAASKEEAKEVIRWFTTSEGRTYLENLIMEDEKNVLPGTEEHYIDVQIPSEEMYDRIMSMVRWQRRRRTLCYLSDNYGILIGILICWVILMWKRCMFLKENVH